jgi:hypothetical protein
MLYHELKSHYFLYLARAGSWEKLCADVLERPRTAAGSVARPQRRRELLRRELRYDRAQIDQRLSTIDSATLRPRYQSDLIEDEDRARFDRELPREEPSDATLVYDPATGEVQCFSAAAALLLERCDGTRTVEQVIEIVPHEVRSEALRCVEDMQKARLFEQENAR